MTGRTRGTIWVIALGILCTAAPSQGQWRPKDTEWPTYTGDLAGTKYRPLDQVNASNFNKLEVAWRFKTDNLGPRPEYKLEGTPLVIKGVLYTTGGTRRSVVALDARTGEQMWVYSLREGNRAEALQVYEQLRQALRDELGVPPSLATQDLFADLNA